MSLPEHKVDGSHGDAALAYLDNSFRLIAVVKLNGNRFSIQENKLEDYFIVKGCKYIDKDKVIKTMRGPAYVKSVYAYVFRKIR